MISLSAQTAFTDVLVVATLLTAVQLLLKVLRGTAWWWVAVAMPAAALVSGLAWKFWPPLIGIRLLPPPSGQAMGIAVIIIFLLFPLIFARFRQAIASLDWRPLAGFSYWRVIYGANLIILGVQGALPAAFFWSGGAGDIAAGLWGLWLVQRSVSQEAFEFKFWNWFALADLMHVLVLGGLYLRPFFLNHPDVPPITLLPLAGVPIMFALHVWAITALSARSTSRA